MRKAEFIQALKKTLEPQTPEDITEFVDAFFQEIGEKLVQGHRIEIRNFGIFEIRCYQHKKLRNPHTGEDVNMDVLRVFHFKMGKKFAQQLNLPTTQTRNK